MSLDVRDFEPADHEWARRLIGDHQGGDHRVGRLGELLDPTEMEGIVAELDGRPVGLLTVHETDRGLEVLTLHSEVSGVGAGTRLLETALRVAEASHAPRLWLVTTNDNVDAIRWYLRRGLTVAAVQDPQEPHFQLRRGVVLEQEPLGDRLRLERAHQSCSVKRSSNARNTTAPTTNAPSA